MSHTYTLTARIRSRFSADTFDLTYVGIYPSADLALNRVLGKLEGITSHDLVGVGIMVGVGDNLAPVQEITVTRIRARGLIALTEAAPLKPKRVEKNGRKFTLMPDKYDLPNSGEEVYRETWAHNLRTVYTNARIREIDDAEVRFVRSVVSCGLTEWYDVNALLAGLGRETLFNEIDASIISNWTDEPLDVDAE